MLSSWSRILDSSLQLFGGGMLVPMRRIKLGQAIGGYRGTKVNILALTTHGTKRVKSNSFSACFLVCLIIAATFAISSVSTSKAQANQPFHFGVTFGGDNSADAKLLIDRVKNYTNLFVVASGPLQSNTAELETTCDYAVKAGLDIIVYFGSYETNRDKTATFIDMAQERWGSHFLGVYYGDEPSGKALDGFLRFDNVPNLGNVSVSRVDITVSQISDSIMTSKTFYFSPGFSGQIIVNYADFAASNYTMINYFPNGTITLAKDNEYLIYLTNGTVLRQTSTLIASNESLALGLIPRQDFQFSYEVVTDKGNISQFEPYQQLRDSRPFQTKDEISALAASYVKTQQASLDWIANQDHVELFTSDYMLYWWDYQIGYDAVFAQLGWNNTVAQEIGLVRGAANLQGKDWGTIVTWKYTTQPYLASGDEIYEQMVTSYKAGAKYVILFNYAEDMKGPYGTMQDEHFDASERFWNEVVQNSSVKHGENAAEAALVLPKDYGWGMRNTNDTIWGLWKPDGVSQQIWSQLQNKLGQYGTKLDIVYEDSAYSVTGKYGQIFYWNQVDALFVTPLLICIAVAAAVAVATLVYLKKRKR